MKNKIDVTKVDDVTKKEENVTEKINAIIDIVSNIDIQENATTDTTEKNKFKKIDHKENLKNYKRIKRDEKKTKVNKKLNKLEFQHKVKVQNNLLSTFAQQSIFFYTNTITGKDIDGDKEIVERNIPLMQKFGKVVSVINLAPDVDDEIMYNYAKWMKSVIGDKCDIIIDEVSREGDYGELDMCKIGYEYCRINYPEFIWIVKVNSNISLEKTFLNIELKSDFMCLPYFDSDTIKFMFKDNDNIKGQMTKITEFVEGFENVDIKYNTDIFVFKNGIFDFIHDPMTKLREDYENDLRNDMFYVSKETNLLSTIIRNKTKPKLLFNNVYMIKFLNKVITDKLFFGNGMENIYFAEYGLCNKKFKTDKITRI